MIGAYAPLCCSLLLTTIPAVRAAVVDADLARFATAKQAQARELARNLTNSVPSYTWSFFDAVQVDDWETATNLAARLSAASGRYSADTKLISPALYTVVWQPIHETIGAYEAFHGWDNKSLHRFGSEIINSIPRGSIFFGGTDPGRFLITALSESHEEGNPFFTVTQNQLADGLYLEYLRAMYGRKLYVPSVADSQKAFQDYLADAQRRLETGRLKPGEDVRIVENRVQVSGQVAVMGINALLAKVIFDKNPDRQFFVEESFPLDWMYPQLSPHGPIFELNRKPLLQLPAETVIKDQEYWGKFVGELVGDWITDKTSVQDVCNFVEKVYLRKDLNGFKGDARFAKNDEAQKCFSKLRSSIAGLYAWRVEHSKDEDEQDRMRKAADLAFRQAFALCPSSPEALFRYTQLLVNRKRIHEAISLTQTSMRFDPENESLKELLRGLRKWE
jgi:hypothetical protein